MIDYVKISDYDNNLMYILNLESRVTIITGDSATGKSTLIRYIENYNKDSYNAIKIESEKELIHLTKSRKNPLQFIRGDFYMTTVK